MASSEEERADPSYLPALLFSGTHRGDSSAQDTPGEQFDADISQQHRERYNCQIFNTFSLVTLQCTVLVFQVSNMIIIIIFQIVDTISEVSRQSGW